jgi:hypothetical protein
MKKFQILFSTIAAIALLVTSCKKVDPLPFYNNGSPVTASGPTVNIAPTPANASQTAMTIAWTSPNYASDPATYKFIVEIDTAGRNFANPVRREVIGKQELALTGTELNNILLNFGFKLGTQGAIDVRVISSYGNNNEQYISKPTTVKVTPYTDPSTLTGSATTVTGTLATASQNALTLNWTRSFTGYSGNITYVLEYDSAGKNFASPHTMALTGTALTKTLTQGEVNTMMLEEGVAGGQQGKIEYRIKATTAQGGVAYSNVVSVTVNTYQPIIRLYMPGSYQAAAGFGTEDWKPETAPEFIRDTRPEALNKLYYMYTYLPANTEFKITSGRSWDLNYGGNNGNLVQNGDNFKVTTAGYYRISVDLANMKYDIREGRMGFVGGAVGAGWTPPNVFPNYAMGLASTNLFVGVTNFTVDGWKLIDNNDWNSGDINATNARSYGSNGPSGSPLIVNGPNMPNPSAAGRYRVIWDGRDPNNVKYEMSPATEMRVVGNGIQNVPDWNPGASPQMTYQGNGVWTINIALKGNKEIKFLAGNDWGAFDYEDASGGNQSLGTARKIKWEGGDNFKTPAADGTYTITLNENLQTVTISQ